MDLRKGMRVASSSSSGFYLFFRKMDHNGMEQLTDMGFTRELAAQALAATGGKSTLKATEWILNNRKPPEGTTSSGLIVARQQVKVDHFFSASSSSKVHAAAAAVAAAAEADQSENPPPKKLLRIEAPPPKPQKQKAFQEPPAKKMKQEDEGGEEVVHQKFTRPEKKSVKSSVPLAERMRPTTVDDILGQDHLLGARGLIRSLLDGDSLASLIFWGPPGTGKTSLARAIAASVSYKFVALSAVSTGVKEVREVLEEAKKVKKFGQRTLLFLDEVHRFNKAQQDAFLPYVESGSVIFIGATTENPSFEINAALLSRCKVLTLNKLQPGHLKKLVERAASDQEKGAGVSAGLPAEVTLRVDDEAASFLAEAADGDARVALNTLEIAVLAAASRAAAGSHRELRAGGDDAGVSVKREAAGELDRVLVEKTTTVVKRESFNILEVLKENVQHSQQEYTRPFKRFVGGKNVTAVASSVAPSSAPAPAPEPEKEASFRDPAAEPVVLVTLADVKDALQRSHVFYDKTGEEHYNIISALHKSMRGGDPDAALYWLARMIEGGEGPLYVARRLVRFASEDVGMADPLALPQAIACYQACHFLGVPECNVHLAQCVVYLALAPKSVAVYQAIEAAQRVVRERGQNEPVPLHLRNAPTRLMKELGYGRGYAYPPSHNGPVDQEYLPPGLRGHKFLRWPPP